MFISILYFFVLFFGLGFSLLWLLKAKFKDIFEQIVMSLGVGLGIFPILAVLLNLLHIPLHFIVFMLIAYLVPLYHLISLKIPSLPKLEAIEPYKEKISRKAIIHFVLIIIFALVLLFVFFKGATTYEYLEDDDPYQHAEGTKYVSLFKTYSVDFLFTTYLEPYPPTYDVLMGVLHQTNNDVSSTMKFFNSLLIALSILFFYFFTRRISDNADMALFASLFLTLIPCYLSHFIWAQSYSLILYPVAFFFIVPLVQKKSKRGNLRLSFLMNKTNFILGALVSASIFVVQTSSAFIYLMFLFLFFLAAWISNRKFQQLLFLVIIAGLLLSQLFWTSSFIKFSDDSIEKYITRSTSETLGIIDKASAIIKGDAPFELRIGQQSKTFLYKDFQVAPKVTKMDQPTGIGTFLFYIFLASILFIIYLLFKSGFRNVYLLTLLFWLVFTFIGVEGNLFPINLVPHRFWAFFALPVVLIAATGTVHLLSSSKVSPKLKLALIVVFLVGIIITSGVPKYVVETSMWPPGHAKWSSQEQLGGYIQMKQQYNGISVFPLCEMDKMPIAFNQMSYSWNKEVWDFRKSLINKTPEELFSFLQRNNYDYYIISSNCVAPDLGFDIGENKTNEFIAAARSQPVIQTNGFLLFKAPY